jgi:hypothetical protein
MENPGYRTLERDNLIFFFFMVLEFELSSLNLLDRCSATSSKPPSLFDLVLFKNRVLLLCPRLKSFYLYS